MLLPLLLCLLRCPPGLSLVEEIPCSRSEGANSSLVVDCSRRGVSSYGLLEGDRFFAATDLSLTHNNLTDFPVARLAARLPHLHRLGLAHNRISAPSATDVSWPSLRHLDLSANVLTEVSARHFAFGRHLLSLNLSGNRIAAVAPNAWLNVHRLERLDLSRNAVVFVSEDWFWGLWRLRELSLAGNAIFHLFRRSFTHLRSLRRLDLAGNKLRIVDPGAFAEQRELDLLRMDGNHLDAFPSAALAHFRRIGAADFAANRFYRLGEGAVAGVNVSELRLGRQPRLVALGAGAFSRLPLTLDLSLDGCPRLRLVDADAFADCPRLARLRLGACGLAAAPVAALRARLPRLEGVDLAGNPLACHCALEEQVRAGPRLLRPRETLCGAGEARRRLLAPNATCQRRPLVLPTFPARLALPEGHALLLQCRAFPPGANVSVEWSLPASAEAPAARRRLRATPDGDLSIADALPALSGRYSCAARGPGGESRPSGVVLAVRPLRARLLLLERRSTALVVTWRRESGASAGGLLLIYRAAAAAHFQHLPLRPYMRSATLGPLQPATPYLLCLAIRSAMDLHRVHCLHASTAPDAGTAAAGDWFRNGTFVVVIVATLGVGLGLLVACLIYCNLQRDAKAAQTESSTALAMESGASTPMAFENRAIMDDADDEAEAEFGSHLSLRELAAVACRQPFVVPERRSDAPAKEQAQPQAEEARDRAHEEQGGPGAVASACTTAADVHVTQQQQQQQQPAEGPCVT